jgi:hypothetical protein
MREESKKRVGSRAETIFGHEKRVGVESMMLGVDSHPLDGQEETLEVSEMMLVGLVETLFGLVGMLGGDSCMR